MHARFARATKWSSSPAGQGQARHGAAPVDAEHVVVEGVNRVKKHQRPNPMKA
jgi:ribosomal protein L24